MIFNILTLLNTIGFLVLIVYLWYDYKVSYDRGEDLVRREIREGKWLVPEERRSPKK